MNELRHHGIKGQKWYVRRFQNYDGTLTEEGRKRLGLDRYDDRDTDTVLKKGQKVSRVVSTPMYDEYADPDIGGSKDYAERYLDGIKRREESSEFKYVSVDGVKNSGRHNGQDYYVSWFTDGGWDPNHAYLSIYELQKDAKVASGKQVVDALLKEVGSERISEILKSNGTVKTLTMDYTTNRNLFAKINQDFIDKGYDAVEDINDLDTDMPVIFLKSSEILGKPALIKSGEEAINEILERQK